MNEDRVAQLIQGNAASFGAVAQPKATPRRADNVVEIEVAMLRPDPDNARKSFDADELQALADNLRHMGQLQNLVVWHDMAANQYQLIAGERRLRAAKLAGIQKLVCMVVPRELTNDIRAEMAFAENMARSDLKPTEVARHWKSLMERWQCTTRELAARVGVAPSTISKRLSLLKLDADTQRDVDAGKVLRTRAVESTRTRRRGTTRRLPRGVHDFPSGVVKLRRGQTLEQLVEQIQATLQPAAEPDHAVERATAA
jgi:ParB/RepB/Spo0J family partition protein